MAVFSSPHQAAGLRFDGLEEGRRESLHGVFTVDPDHPTANGRPHYKTEAGGHLYYSINGKWFLSDKFTPDEDNAAAWFATAGEVPKAATWQWYDGNAWGERALTLTEL